MTKQEAISMVAKLVGSTKVDAEKNFEAVLEVMEYCVKNKEPLKLVGHFSMEVVERAERQGVNPSTKEKITIPSTMAVKFKVGKKLKDMAKA